MTENESVEFPKTSLESKDLVTERVREMRELFPEVFSEGGIDFEKLRLVLGDEVDDADERYAFTWPGKRDAIRQSQTVSTATLRPCEEESVAADGTPGSWEGTENLYIEGDNLEVLKLLQASYHGKVKLIYIDPPYNTGHDFVYKDSFGDTLANYKEQTAQAEQSNPETSGRYHANWCSMMYPRLRLARELLSDDGAIFISIDDNEEKNLRAICDEVFGESNFVGNVAWQRTYSPRNDAKGIPTVVEHVVVYSKNSGWEPKKLPRTEEMNAAYGSPDADSKLWASDNPAAAGGASHQGMVYGIQHPFTGEIMYPPMGSHWRIGQPGLLSIMAEWAPYELRDLDDAERRAEVCGIAASEVREGVKGVVLSVSAEEGKKAAQRRYDEGNWPLLYFTGGGTGGVRRKRYLDDSAGRLATNLWPHEECGHTDEAKKELKKLFDGNAPFDTPKPVRLMKRILDIASEPDSIVLDFFSGSATMGEAVMRANVEDGGHRRFILVQIPEPTSGQFPTICEAGKERIRRAGKQIAAEVEEANRQPKLGEDPKQLPDIGFRVLKLDESGIATPRPGELLLNRVKVGRSDEDIIFEMMLKWGLELTYPVEKMQVAGYPCYTVAGDALICCMEPGLTTGVIEAIAELAPDRVFVLDSVLDDSAKLNMLQTFRRVEEHTQHKIDLRTV